MVGAGSLEARFGSRKKSRTKKNMAKTLSEAGFDVTTATVDVSVRASVEALVEQAASLGSVHHLIHAAGVSPSQATPWPAAT